MREKKEKKKKGHKFLKFMLMLLIIIFVVLGGIISYSTYKNGWGWKGLLATMMGHDQTTVENLEPFTVLLMGFSDDISAKLTDSIMVASYNPKTQQAVLLSIPRDTFVGDSKSSASSYDKINALYQKSPETTLEAVNEITGLDIQYYAVINNNALVEVVDAIGGVEFNVPIDMTYDDPTQDLHINLKAGLQTLNGDQAEQLVRFRHNNDGSSYDSEYGDNDIGRMRTQREFISAIASQTIQLKNITKIGELIDIVYNNLETNINISDVTDYLPYALEFDTANIQTATIPGSDAMMNSLYFYEYDEEETAILIDELFNATDATEEETTTESSVTVTTTEAAEIKIEIINSSGSSNNLTTAVNDLKRKGYNISNRTTSSTTSDITTIINNTGVSEDIITNVKDLLGCGVESTSATNASTSADVTIILGKDF